MFEHRFRSRSIEKVNVDEENMEFLYSDGDDYYFMNTKLRADPPDPRNPGRRRRIPDADLQIKVEFFDGKP